MQLIILAEMFGLSKSKNKEDEQDATYLSIDIGTENIKIALFKIIDNEVNIIGYSRTKQKSFAMNKALIMDVDEVMVTIDKGIGKALYVAEKKFTDVALPKQMVIGIAGELVTGVPIVVHVDRDDPDEKITEEEIRNILDKVKEHTFQSTIEDIAEEIGMNPKQIEEIETQVNTISINGTKTKNPVGLTGEEIVYRVFSSFAPRIQKESIQKVASGLDLELVDIIVEPYALACSLEDITNDPNGAIVIDIGAGTTDVAVVRESDVLGIKMFAIGGRVFTKRISKELGIEDVEAEKIKIEYSQSAKKKINGHEIDKVLKKDIDAWLIGLELALSEMDDVNEFPANIYLCGGGAFLPDIKEGLMSHPWIQRLNFKKHPRINFLYPNKIYGVRDLTRLVTEPIDVTPIALTRSMLKKIL